MGYATDGGACPIASHRADPFVGNIYTEENVGPFAAPNTLILLGSTRMV